MLAKLRHKPARRNWRNGIPESRTRQSRKFADKSARRTRGYSRVFSCRQSAYDETFPGRRFFSRPDRKSTRLNSSHVAISYAVFCLKKKKVWPCAQGTVQPLPHVARGSLAMYAAVAVRDH